MKGFPFSPFLSLSLPFWTLKNPMVSRVGFWLVGLQVKYDRQ